MFEKHMLYRMITLDMIKISDKNISIAKDMVKTYSLHKKIYKYSLEIR